LISTPDLVIFYQDYSWILPRRHKGTKKTTSYRLSFIKTRF